MPEDKDNDYKLLVLYGDYSPKGYKWFTADEEEQALDFAIEHNQDTIYLVRYHWHTGIDGPERLPYSTPISIRKGP